MSMYKLYNTYYFLGTSQAFNYDSVAIQYSQWLLVMITIADVHSSCSTIQGTTVTTTSLEVTTCSQTVTQATNGGNNGMPVITMYVHIYWY